MTSVSENILEVFQVEKGFVKFSPEFKSPAAELIWIITINLKERFLGEISLKSFRKEVPEKQCREFSSKIDKFSLSSWWIYTIFDLI